MPQDRLQHVTLARLLIAPPEGVLVSAVKRDLKVWTTPGSDFGNALEQGIEALVSDGLVERPKSRYLRSTPAGRKVALRFLGVPSLPAKLAWSRLKNIYIAARALGLPPPLSPKAVQRIGTASGMRAAILRRDYSLPIEDYPTLIQARDALAWKLLGCESSEPFSTSRVLAWALGKELPTHVEKPSDAVARIAAMKVGARSSRPAELRSAVVQSWLQGAMDMSVEAESSVEAHRTRDLAGDAEGLDTVELQSFALRVQQTARECTSGRFGEGKVFISHVWKQLQHGIDGPSVEVFKERLGEANRLGLISLSRADLVQAMDPDDVRESETKYLNARFHFVRVP